MTGSAVVVIIPVSENAGGSAPTGNTGGGSNSSNGNNGNNGVMGIAPGKLAGVLGGLVMGICLVL